MNRLHSFVLLSIIFIGACKHPIQWKISVDEWNMYTLNAINSIAMDSSFYDSLHLGLTIDSTIIHSFNDHINFYLTNRDFIVSLIDTSVSLRNSDTLYIFERYPGNDYCSCDYSFIIYNNKPPYYHNKYQVRRDTLVLVPLRNVDFHDHINRMSYFFVGYDRILEKIDIVTKIWKSNSEIKVEVIGIVMA